MTNTQYNDMLFSLTNEIERLKALLTAEREFPVEIFSPGHYVISLKDAKVSFRKVVDAC